MSTSFTPQERAALSTHLQTAFAPPQVDALLGLADAARANGAAESVAMLGGRMDRVESALERVANAQARADERLEQLVAAQQKAEKRLGRVELAIERLAEAQQKTESALHDLARQVGGISNRMGSDLEDAAYIVLHDVLTRRGWKVGELSRTWQYWGGQEREIDLWGKAVDDQGRTLCIIGETKWNLTVSEVEKFAKMVESAREHLTEALFPVCFCHRARPEVQTMAKANGFALAYSYGRME